MPTNDATPPQVPGTDDNDAEQHGNHPHICEHLLVGWIMGVYREGVREEGDGALAPVPHHCEHSLTGWTRC